MADPTARERAHSLCLDDDLGYCSECYDGIKRSYPKCATCLTALSKVEAAILEAERAAVDRQPAMYFDGTVSLDSDGPRVCAVCAVHLNLAAKSYRYSGNGLSRDVCATCHSICGGQLPRDKAIALLRRELREAERAAVARVLKRLGDEDVDAEAFRAASALPPSKGGLANKVRVTLAAVRALLEKENAP